MSVPSYYYWPDKTRPLHGGWKLTCDHAMSSYGVPVLVDPNRQAYGPTDLLSQQQVAEMRGVTPGSVRLALDRGSLPATIMPGMTVRLIRASDAVRAKGRKTKAENVD